MVVAIDGPAGTGKSTISKRVAEQTEFFYLNSGRFYRAITWKALRQGKGIENPQALIATAADISITVEEDQFLIDGVPRDQELHTPEVDGAVATVSSIPEIRIAVNNRLKRIAGERDIVVEGRDMSTVVFPQAEVKIYLDADANERARRRLDQHGSGDFEDIRNSIAKRDQIDRTKQTGRLQRTKEAIYLDTTDLTIEQVCEKVIAIIHEKNQHGRSI
ncbi:MAG TPA: (d)CMP kinase [Alkalispirochaeta sp.]|nr:(d)CMP kinase [Alkalispirochaeta sp.]